MEKLKNKNRRYLKRVFTVKTFFYPIMRLFIITGLAFYLERFLTAVVRLFGINKSTRYFYKYVNYSKLFKGEFNDRQEKPVKMLFPMMTGVNSNFTLMNLLFAKYFLSKDGIQPILFICDAAFDICSKDGMLKTRKSYPWFCHECWKGFKHIESKTGIEMMRMSEYIDYNNPKLVGELQKIDALASLPEHESYNYDGSPLGALARKSVLRYFLTGKLIEDAEVIACYKKFLKAGIQYHSGFDTLLNKNKDVQYMIINNGTLMFEGIAIGLCNRKGIRFITYESFMGDNTVIYKKNGVVMDLNWNNEYLAQREQIRLTNGIQENVQIFFDNLQKGVELYALLNKEHNNDKLKGVKRYACLFTNLNYDTAVIDKNSIFESMEDWLISTIEYWKNSNTDITLIIRIHPGELKLVTASKEFMGERLRKVCNNHNRVVIFDADEEINSYELIEGMEFGLIYSSTIGLEIAWRNKTCIIAGLPWFRLKPFVITPQTQQEYYQTLDAHFEKSFSFTPDKDELIRTVWYFYFVRLKRLKGIKVSTRKEEINTVYDDTMEMIEANEAFLDELREELFGE